MTNPQPVHESLPQTAADSPPPFMPRALRFLRRRGRMALWQAQSLFGKYHCNVCGHRVGHFLPLSAVHPGTVANKLKHGFCHEQETFNEREYSCPFCGATDHDRLYALYLDELLAKNHVADRIRIVDFAPVRCLSTYIRRKMQTHSGTYRTADLFDPNVDDQVDLMDMHIYRDGQFDFFICSHVLEHVNDDRKALRELFRVTSSGGSGIVMVPVALDVDKVDEDPSVTDEGERWRRFGQHDHVRLYSKKVFLERLQEAGFKVTELGVSHFGAEKLDPLAILRESILYIVTRPV
ncbi:MAG TPA: methyltransferase domain-containing protein [Verrucomicrobiae bacterium]|nr:methyltransferase domain-containing protein [Verrucomicrobiae bacterium]